MFEPGMMPILAQAHGPCRYVWDTVELFSIYNAQPRELLSQCCLHPGRGWPRQQCCFGTGSNAVYSLHKKIAISWPCTEYSLLVESKSELSGCVPQQQVTGRTFGILGWAWRASCSERPCSKEEEVLAWHRLYVENTFLCPHRNYY